MVIFLGAVIEVCANFGAIGAIAHLLLFAQMSLLRRRIRRICEFSFSEKIYLFSAIFAHASTHAPKLRRNCANIALL